MAMETNELIDVHELTPFKKFIMSIGNIPTSYLESMTYAELLMWFCNYLQNTVIPTVNNNGEAVEELQNLFVQLHNYVENYFENLDVQEEINNKLDAMVEDGTLQEIITDYLNAKAIFCYDTVADMKNATNLIDGSFTSTLGYHSVNDGGRSLYKITDTQPLEGYYETLNNGLYAVLIFDEYLKPEQVGAYGDGVHDDTLAVQTAFNLGHKVLLNNRFRCTETITINNAHLLTITGTEIVKTGLSFENEAYLNIGGDSNVNELRLNKFYIMGDLSQSVLLKLNNITNIYMNEVSLSEASGYLLELNHGDIVFIDKCIFAGSNVLGTWLPCKGIKLTSGHPIRVTNCNIWNLTQFIDVLNDYTKTISLTNNWIEFVNIVINCENHRLINANLIINNNNIAWSPHGDNPDFSNGKVVNLDTITDGFDVLVSLKQNNIIFYTTYPIETLVKITALTGQTNVYIQENVMFTRLSQSSIYALKLDNKNSTRLFYSSTTNADKDRGCNIDGAIVQLISPNQIKVRTLNLQSNDNVLPANQMENGQLLYNAALFIKHSDAIKAIPISSGETISDFADTSTVTTTEVANKLNILMGMLRRSYIIR